MSAMLEDAATAAAAARRTHDSLCRAGAITQEKMEGVAATLAGVHDDALALQLQADAAYALVCKVAAPPPTQLPPSSPQQLTSSQVQSRPLFARASGL